METNSFFSETQMTGLVDSIWLEEHQLCSVSSHEINTITFLHRQMENTEKLTNKLTYNETSVKVLVCRRKNKIH